jgi:hypothetical protein
VSDAGFSAFGLPLDMDDCDLSQPLEALVVVKGLDSRGKVCHWLAKTADLTMIEAWGMAAWAAEEARKS